MKYDIPINYLSDNRISRDTVELAPTCPCCGIALLPTVLYAACTEHEDEENNIVYLLNHCQNCDECFISTHTFDKEIDEGYVFSSFAPIKSSECTFSESITALSADFVSIYNQATLAESLGLNHICGIGYRKALEFLIKDYAISIHPESREQIESSLLGKCITDFIDNEKIKTLAKASAWLGNDETHYIRKHQNRTIQDLKRFIKATVAYVEYELSFTEAFDFLNNSQ